MKRKAYSIIYDLSNDGWIGYISNKWIYRNKNGIWQVIFVHMENIEMYTCGIITKSGNMSFVWASWGRWVWHFGSLKISIEKDWYEWEKWGGGKRGWMGAFVGSHIEHLRAFYSLSQSQFYANLSFVSTNVGAFGFTKIISIFFSSSFPPC